jgi:monoterpene epsilon-lactone hydrolase
LSNATSASSCSLASRIAALSLKRLLKPLLGPQTSIKWQRRFVGSMEYILPRPVNVRREQLAGDGLDGYKLTPLGSHNTKTAILFFHGGGYGVGSPGTHLALTMRIARQTGLTVFSPTYRLAPEARFPAQLQDASCALDALRQQGIATDRLILAGDSAGGNLALALVQTLKAEGRPMPLALVLISPWADISLSQLPADPDDALLSPVWAAQMRDAFVASEHWHDPLVSPVFASFSGFPPTLIQAATAELMVRDSERLFLAMRTAGVAVDFQLAPGLWHDYQLLAGVVPESDRAIDEIARFVERNT